MEPDAPRCNYCGAEMERVTCYACGGEGVDGHDCGEDVCCCLYPEDNELCDVCNGRGRYWECPNLPHTAPTDPPSAATMTPLEFRNAVYRALGDAGFIVRIRYTNVGGAEKCILHARRGAYRTRRHYSYAGLWTQVVADGEIAADA